MRTLLIGCAGAAILSGCASTAVLKKPIEAQSAVMTKSTEAIGSTASSYKRATRLTALRDTDTLGSLAASLKSSSPNSIVATKLICNPLKAAQIRLANAKAIQSFGKSLSTVVTDSPTSFVGLLGTLDDDYIVKIATSSVDDATMTALTASCKSTVAESAIRNKTDPDYLELKKINERAYSQGIPEGAGETAGLTGIVTLIESILAIGKGVLNQADQAKRKKALKTFYENPENTETLKKEIIHLDHAVRVAELGQRIEAKSYFAAAVNSYSQSQQAPYDVTKQYKSRTMLMDASDKLDDVILAKMKERLSVKAKLKNAYSQSTANPAIALAYFSNRESMAGLSKITDEKKREKTRETLLKSAKSLEKKMDDKTSYKRAYDDYIAANADITNKIEADTEGKINVHAEIFAKCNKIPGFNLTSITTDQKIIRSTTCPLTDLGQALLDSHFQLQALATGDWDNFTDAQKTAYWESVFASASQLISVQKELAKFANDKSNLVILRSL